MAYKAIVDFVVNLKSLHNPRRQGYGIIFNNDMPHKTY